MKRMEGSLQPRAKEQEASVLTLTGLGGATGVGSTWEREGEGVGAGVDGNALRKAPMVCVTRKKREGVEAEYLGLYVCACAWHCTCDLFYM